MQAESAASVSDTLTAADNRVFGINVNSSAFNLSRAKVSATGNALGIGAGARANLQTLMFGTYTCDATMLIRGTWAASPVPT